MTDTTPQVGGDENELITTLYGDPTQEAVDEVEATLRRRAAELGRPTASPVEWSDPERMEVPGGPAMMQSTARLPLGDPE